MSMIDTNEPNSPKLNRRQLLKGAAGAALFVSGMATDRALHNITETPTEYNELDREPTPEEMLMFLKIINEYVNPNADNLLFQRAGTAAGSSSPADNHFSISYATTNRESLTSANITYHTKQEDEFPTFRVEIHEPDGKLYHSTHVRIGFNYPGNKTLQELQDLGSQYFSIPADLTHAPWQDYSYYETDSGKKKEVVVADKTEYSLSAYTDPDQKWASIELGITFPDSDPHFFLPTPLVK